MDVKSQFFEAILLKNEPKVKELLSKQPNLVGAVAWDGSNCLHLATTNNDISMIKLLLSHGGAAKDLPDKAGHTPFGLAIKKARLEILHAFIEDTKTRSNMTEMELSLALREATFYGDVSLVQLLLQQGASVTNVKHVPVHPVAWAIVNHKLEIFKVFVDHCSALNIPVTTMSLGEKSNHPHWYPMHIAVLAGDIQIIEYLGKTLHASFDTPPYPDAVSPLEVVYYSKEPDLLLLMAAIDRIRLPSLKILDEADSVRYRDECWTAIQLRYLANVNL